MSKKIALVEDEKDLNSLIKYYLEQEGYTVVPFISGEDAVEHIKENFDLWILDIMLEGQMDGYDLIKIIRNHYKDVPVIFTSARDKELDKILGLELGSDDYVTKPYSPKELILRVNNIIKRVYHNTEEKKIKYNSYDIDLDKRLVFENDDELDLTSLEFNLLLVLIANQNKNWSRAELLNMVWGEDYFGSDRVVDDLVRRLRKKMPNCNIKTVYGYGYRLT